MDGESKTRLLATVASISSHWVICPASAPSLYLVADTPFQFPQSQRGLE